MRIRVPEMILALIDISKRPSAEQAHEADLVLEQRTLPLGCFDCHLLGLHLMFGQMLSQCGLAGEFPETDVTLGGGRARITRTGQVREFHLQFVFNEFTHPRPVLLQLGHARVPRDHFFFGLFTTRSGFSGLLCGQGLADVRGEVGTCENVLEEELWGFLKAQEGILVLHVSIAVSVFRVKQVQMERIIFKPTWQPEHWTRKPKCITGASSNCWSIVGVGSIVGGVMGIWEKDEKWFNEQKLPHTSQIWRP